MAGGIRNEPEHAEGLERLRRTVKVRLRRQASTLAHDHSHVERVYRNALEIAQHCADDEGDEIDGDALEAACLLHEIGRGAQRRGENLADATLRIAEEMLRGDGLGDLVWPVLEALAQHVTSGREPESNEARVLHDADLLEDLGAIGLARTLAEGVSAATPLLYDETDPLASGRDLDDASYLLDRLPKRHFHLADRAVTAWGRAEARHRAKTLAAYYKAFFREARVEPG